MVPQRVDLLSVKAKLFSALGANAAKYWEVLKRWMFAKLTKPEFEYQIKKYVPDEAVSLHNFFLSGILYNAKSEQIPKTLIERWKASSHPTQLAVKKQGQKRKISISAQKSMTEGSAVKKLKLVPVKNKQNPFTLSLNAVGYGLKNSVFKTLTKPLKPTLKPPGQGLQDVISRYPHRRLHDEWRYEMELEDVKLPQTPMAKSTKGPPAAPQPSLPYWMVPASLELPDRESIRRIMTSKAHSAGVKSVNADSVQYMVQALEEHLKQIIGSCVKRVHPQRESGFPSLNPPSAFSAGLNTITVKDLLGAIQHDSKIRLPDKQLTLEKIRASLR